MSTKIDGIPTRTLGSTGVQVTILGVGGYSTPPYSAWFARCSS
jgi:hypothetical protein